MNKIYKFKVINNQIKSKSELHFHFVQVLNLVWHEIAKKSYNDVKYLFILLYFTF